MKNVLKAGLIVVAVVFMSSYVFAHCQIPCGIYDDEMRIDMMEEHVRTIEKSMNTIIELSRADEKNMNQIVRWVNNKDSHADQLSEIVTYYFMTQRLKPVADKDSEEYKVYLKRLELLQEILFYTMKAKQTVDLEYVTKLRSIIHDFEDVYFSKDKSEPAK